MVNTHDTHSDTVSWELDFPPQHDPRSNYLIPLLPYPTNPLTGRPATWHMINRTINNRYNPIPEDKMFDIGPFAAQPLGNQELGFLAYPYPENEFGTFVEHDADFLTMA